MFEAQRVVTDGDIRPIDGAKNGSSLGADGNPLPAVNNGVYNATTQVLSLGISMAFDEMARSNRVVRYHADYEDDGVVARPQVTAATWRPSESGDESVAAREKRPSEADDASADAEAPAAADAPSDSDGFAVDVVTRHPARKHLVHKRLRRRRGRR